MITVQNLSTIAKIMISDTTPELKICYATLPSIISDAVPQSIILTATLKF
jgi:hypothetical protein